MDCVHARLELFVHGTTSTSAQTSDAGPDGMSSHLRRPSPSLASCVRVHPDEPQEGIAGVAVPALRGAREIYIQ